MPAIWAEHVALAVFGALAGHHRPLPDLAPWSRKGLSDVGVLSSKAGPARFWW
jgi:hypothetical protein